MGWGRVASAAEVHQIACSHTEIVAQRAELITERLKGRLDEIDGCSPVDHARRR
jgi:hypothetical protein